VPEKDALAYNAGTSMTAQKSSCGTGPWRLILAQKIFFTSFKKPEMIQKFVR
jgi:hypothetical protein